MLRRLLLLVVGIALLAGQAALRPWLQAAQQEAGLAMPARADSAGDAAIPVLALGAFRGLLIDYLWLRAMTLRDQGRHHEARQLAEQICALQPRMWEVWAYMGHDLAYNVATVVDHPDERWRWVQNGIEHLRDKGIAKNPAAPELYFMLARVFHDKIASGRDDYHKLFKQRHAQSMLELLGDPQVDLAALAAAPAWESLQDEPEAQETIELLARFHDDPRRLALQLELARTCYPEALARIPAAEPLRPRRELASWPRLILAARRALLAEQCRFDAERMLAIDREWGPLDWRGVDASTIYWAAEGLRVARDEKVLAREREMLRTTLSALRNAMNTGRLQVFPDGTLATAPMLELVAKVEALTRETVSRAEARQAELQARHDAPGSKGLAPDEAAELVELDGFINNQRYARLDFLLQGVQLLHDYGREKAARELFAAAQREFPEHPVLAVRDFDAWLNIELARRFIDPDMMYETHVTVSQKAEGCWVSAFKALAMGQDEKFRAQQRLAEAQATRWRRYLASQEGLDPRVRERLSVPFEQVRDRAVYTAYQQLSPFLRRRLLEVLPAWFDRNKLEAPPQLNLPRPRTEGE